MFYLGALLAVVIDQALKYLIVLTLRHGQSLPLIGNFLNLTYVRNRGAAWGLFSGQNWLLLSISVLVMLLVLYYHFKLDRKDLLQLGLGLVLGGSLGNALDRMTRQYVVDFIDLRFWPVFNFADLMIDLGVLIIIFRLFFSKEGKNVPDPF